MKIKTPERSIPSLNFPPNFAKIADSTMADNRGISRVTDDREMSGWVVSRKFWVFSEETIKKLENVKGRQKACLVNWQKRQILLAENLGINRKPINDG